MSRPEPKYKVGQSVVIVTSKKLATQHLIGKVVKILEVEWKNFSDCKSQWGYHTEGCINEDGFKGYIAEENLAKYPTEPLSDWNTVKALTGWSPSKIETGPIITEIELKRIKEQNKKYSESDYLNPRRPGNGKYK